MDLRQRKLSWLPWVIWACGAIFYGYQFTLRVAPSVMTEDLMQSFAVQGCALGILSGFYFNTYAALQIPLGMILDQFGQRRILAISCLLCAGGAFLFAASESLNVASFGRLLMGAGSACAYLGTLKLATLWFPSQKLGRVIGLTMLMGTLGAMAGKRPFATLVDQIGWRPALSSLAVFGLILAILIWSVVRDRNVEEKTPDKSLKFTFWGGFQRVVASPQVWAIAIFGSLMYIPYAAFADLWGDAFLMKVYQIDRTVAATAVSMIFFGTFVGAPLMTYFSDYIGKRRTPMVIGAIASFLIYSIIIFVPQVPLFLLFVLLFLAGFFFTGQLLCFAAVCEIMPRSMSGIVIGFTNMIVMLSGVIFQPLLGWMLDFSWNGEILGGVPHYTVADWRFALAPIPICLFLSILLLKLIPETYPTSED